MFFGCKDTQKNQTTKKNFAKKSILKDKQLNIIRIWHEKKIEEGSVEEQIKAELSDRISQIRQTFCEDNNREFSELINVNEQALSQICSGKRNAGLEIVQKILDNLPEIDANWLLRGKGNMTIDRSGKSLSVQDSPQATISNNSKSR